MTFAYQNVYGYSSLEGPMVVTWGRRACVISLPCTRILATLTACALSGLQIRQSTLGENTFSEILTGDQSAAPEYWYYYQSDDEKYPTTTGLSVKYVSDILIDTPSLPLRVQEVEVEVEVEVGAVLPWRHWLTIAHDMDTGGRN